MQSLVDFIHKELISQLYLHTTINASQCIRRICLWCTNAFAS